MNYLQSNNNRYRHHFCIFAKYRINMKREILYQKIAGTIAWQIKTGIWKASGICTYHNNDDFFSARRQGIRSGRILSGILLGV